MRWSCWVWLMSLGCPIGKGDGRDSTPSSHETTSSAVLVDTAIDTAHPPEDSAAPSSVSYSIEYVNSTTLPGLTGVRDSVVESIHGNTFVLGLSGSTIRLLLPSWIHPSGVYCAGGTLDEEGECRGGEHWVSGRIDASQSTRQLCLDAARQELILVKDNGRQLEVLDVGIPGEDPYSYLRAIRRVDLPGGLAASGSYTGSCAVVPVDGSIVLTSTEQQALAIVDSGETPGILRKKLLSYEPGNVAVVGDQIVVLDRSRNRVEVLGLDDLAVRAEAAYPRPVNHMTVEAETGVIWLTAGAGRVERLVFDALGESRRTGVELTGRVAHLVSDGRRGLAWAVVQEESAWTLVLLSADGVLAEQVMTDPVLGLGVPRTSGDVAVYVDTAATDAVGVRVFAPVSSRDVEPPLHGFLFTTIEEPSELNMGQPCLGEDDSFARELSLVRHNAEALAELGIPVALAISDNFTQKAKECGETGIFAELAAHDFTLGVLIHNRPCYHCTDGSHDANPDACARTDPHWIRAMSTAACFPNDPEYCALGDWGCYRDLVSPRIDLVDRHIPGGGQFIVGADRHRMWDYDWIRLYQEVERSTVDRTGFDLTMFANAWAYDDISAIDPRGKNVAPWSVADQTVPWRLGDVTRWTQDAPLSDVIYLPGSSTSTVKIAEQRSTGLYMIDFFTAGIPVAYQPSDFEVLWQVLRSAINHRKPDRVNSWYFHIHDLGILNLRDKDGNRLQYDSDGADGPEPPVPLESLLAGFVAQVDARYGAEGSFVWSDPRSIRAMVAP
jgi:hypothetical protein